MEVGVIAPADLSMDKAASIRMNNINKSMCDEDMSLDVFCFCAPNGGNTNINYHSVRQTLTKKELHSWKRLWLLSLLLLQLLKRCYRFDCLYCHHIDGGLVGTAVRIMTLGRIQFILDLHGPFIEELKHYELVTNQYLLSLLSLGERAVYMSAAHIFVTSTGLSKIVTTKVDSNKVNVLYDYVSLEMFSPQKSTVLESYGVKNNFVIMYVGMLKDYQGVDYLIDAFAEVNTEELEFNLQLVIVGNSNIGYYRDIAADRGIENKVTFTGLQPHSEIPQFMAAADILVAPRIDTDVTQGGFLSQLPEYLAMQKPIIATDVSDSKKVLDDGKYGLLVPDSDTTALANAISQLAQDDELRRTIAEGTRERAERYSWQHGYKKIERKVESIVNTNQGESQ